MERTLEEIKQALTRNPAMMELFNEIYSAPEEQRAGLISAALEVLEKNTQKGAGRERTNF